VLNLEPAARQVAEIVKGIGDGQLAAPTPCEYYSVGDLLDHFMGLTVAFRDAATKASLESGYKSVPPDSPDNRPSVANLDPDWRNLLPQRLDDLAAAWQQPSAWQGMAQAGGVTMPAELMALVATNELVVHGWDLAAATGQAFDADTANLQAAYEFAELSAKDGEDRAGLFGPVIEIPGDAPLLDRLLGLTGRNPGWTAK
jgi:uncharacterized protein (TIGR03086 family)